MPPDEAGLLLDMLLAARRAHSYVRDASRADFDGIPLLQDAVAHQIQIIGEAASQVSEEFRNSHPEIPWREIIGMRHRLVHGYREVRSDVLWATARDAVPPLVAALEHLVPPEKDE